MINKGFILQFKWGLLSFAFKKLATLHIEKMLEDNSISINKKERLTLKRDKEKMDKVILTNKKYRY